MNRQTFEEWVASKDNVLSEKWPVQGDEGRPEDAWKKWIPGMFRKERDFRTDPGSDYQKGVRDYEEGIHDSQANDIIDKREYEIGYSDAQLGKAVQVARGQARPAPRIRRSL